MQKVTESDAAKSTHRHCAESARGVFFVSSIDEDVVQIIGVLWLQIPFKDLHLYAAKIPDMS
jgi:hypothetical protein